jgi:hypothetical protein
VNDVSVGAKFSTAELLGYYQHLWRIGDRFGIRLTEHESRGVAAMQQISISDVAHHSPFTYLERDGHPMSKYFGKKLIG